MDNEIILNLLYTASVQWDPRLFANDYSNPTGLLSSACINFELNDDVNH